MDGVPRREFTSHVFATQGRRRTPLRCHRAVEYLPRSSVREDLVVLWDDPRRLLHVAPMEAILVDVTLRGFAVIAGLSVAREMLIAAIAIWSLNANEAGREHARALIKLLRRPRLRRKAGH
jgi:hypothetical protein